MQKNHQKPRLFVVLSFLCFGFNPTAWANYDEALQAYDNKDYKTAFREFSLLAGQGNKDAQLYMAYMYDNGHAVPKNEKQAAVWYRKAAEQGDKTAQYNLGVKYENGLGVPKNAQQAVSWYRKAADQGDVDAQFNLAVMYENGRGVSKDEQQAIIWYRKAAEQGDDDAQYILGVIYFNGQGILKDENQAMVWYLKAAEHGNTLAQLDLGTFYADGLGVPKDEQQAITWLNKSAKQGNAEAQYKLGVHYENGRGTPKDANQAFTWYRKAAEQGNANAQISLGYMYAFGLAVNKDEQQSVIWYRKAADNGNALAQNNLAAMYVNGQGVIKDDKQAMKWYRKAAEQGDANAQYSLGVGYLNGIGVPKDETQAYFWWLLAGAKGVIAAKQNIGNIEKVLLPQQRENAQEEAQKWRPNTPQQIVARGFSDAVTESLKDSSESDALGPKIKGEKSSGTGFVVSPNKVVTNVHVVNGCAILKVNGKTATVSSMDTSNDLALIDTSLNGSVATLRVGKLRQGDEINAVGYPLHGLLASGAQITSGNVSALAGMQNDSRFIQISAPVQPGNSGGPLVDASGNVVGVIVSKLNAVAIASMNGDLPQNINFAISPLVLKGFLEANLVKYKTAASNKNLSTANVMSIAALYTVLVECIK